MPGPTFGAFWDAECSLHYTFLPTESSWQLLGTKYVLQCCGWRHKWFHAQGALGSSDRGLCCADTHAPSLRHMPWGALEQSPETQGGWWGPSWVKGRCLYALGSPVWERGAILCSLHSLGRSLSPAALCQHSLPPATASLLPTGLPVRCLFPLCKKRTFTGVSLAPANWILFWWLPGSFPPGVWLWASPPLQSLRCTPSPFLSGHPNHYSTM